jgi:hypothetical protein
MTDNTAWVRRENGASGAWYIYMPETRELFGTQWLPLPLTADADFMQVKLHVLSLGRYSDVKRNAI